MAKVRKGVYSGIIGGVSFADYKGKQVVKSLPVKKKRKPTPAQKLQRDKMIAVNSFIRGIKSVIAVGYQDSDKLSPYNECVSELLKSAVVLRGEEYFINHPLVKISRGSLPAPEIDSITKNGNSIELKWNPSISNRNGRKNDEACVLLCSDSGETKFFDSIGFRSDGSGELSIPDRFKSKCHAWMFFSNPKLHTYESKKKVSNSLYLGEF